MNTQKKRLFNFRPLVIIALVAIFTIILCNGIYAFGINLGIIVLFFVVCSLSFATTNKAVIEFIANNKIFIISCILVSLFILTYITSSVALFNYKYPDKNVTMQITARVDLVEDSYLVIDDATVSYYSFSKNEQVTNQKLDGKLYVFNAGSYNSVKANQIINFTGKVHINNIYEENAGINIYYFVYNSLGVVVADDVITATNEFRQDDIFSPLRKYCYDSFLSGMSKESANIAYAILFGDTFTLGNLYDNFQGSGVAHIIAVSGLHVGFLVSLILIIAKIFKIKKKPTFIVTAIILFLYAWICGFRVSVIRASIMALVFMFSKIINKKYDMLNSIAFACILVLLVCPYDLFSLGFQLSFSAVLGIALLSEPLKRWLSKFLPSFVASSFSVTLAATIATLPFLLVVYNEQCAVAVLVNLIIIPLASLGYISCIICFMVTTIMPFLSFGYFIPNAAFTLMNFITNWVNGIDKFKISLGYFKLMPIVIMLLMFLISDFCFSSKFAKKVGAGVLACSLLLILGLC